MLSRTEACHFLEVTISIQGFRYYNCSFLHVLLYVLNPSRSKSRFFNTSCVPRDKYHLYGFSYACPTYFFSFHLKLSQFPSSFRHPDLSGQCTATRGAAANGEKANGEWSVHRRGRLGSKILCIRYSYFLQHRFRYFQVPKINQPRYVTSLRAVLKIQRDRLLDRFFDIAEHRCRSSIFASCVKNRSPLEIADVSDDSTDSFVPETCDYSPNTLRDLRGRRGRSKDVDKKKNKRKILSR